MKIEPLRRWIEASPFRPFSINPANDRELHLPHRDFVSPSPNYRMLTGWHPEDSRDIVHFMRVIGFHLKPQSNGKSKPSKPPQPSK
jgi:hypothetical protein